jgi:hypothetical protein
VAAERSSSSSMMHNCLWLIFISPPKEENHLFHCPFEGHSLVGKHAQILLNHTEHHCHCTTVIINPESERQE